MMGPGDASEVRQNADCSEIACAGGSTPPKPPARAGYSGAASVYAEDLDRGANSSGHNDCSPSPRR